MIHGGMLRPRDQKTTKESSLSYSFQIEPDTAELPLRESWAELGKFDYVFTLFPPHRVP
jgi:hypothetical protein